MQFLKIDYLVDALVLLLHDNRPDYQQLVKKVIDAYESDKIKGISQTNKEEEIANLYICLIQEVIASGITVEDSKGIDTFILKFKSNPLLTKDPELFTTLKDIFTDKEPLDEDRKIRIVQKMGNELTINLNSKLIKQAFGRLSSITADDLVKQQQLLSDIKNICNEIVKVNEDNQSLFKTEDENTARTVDFGDEEQLLKALQVYNTVSVQNRFKTGLSAMNRALQGGFAQGSTMVFASLSHNCKSLMLMKMARWMVTLNHVAGKFNNPTCILYSLENETPQNLMQLFREMYVNEYKQLPPSDLPLKDIADYCRDAFGKYGWKLIIERRVGAEFGFNEFAASFEGYVKVGYTPLMCIIDYANLMAKGGSTGDNAETGTNNLQIQMLYNNLCNFAKSRNCTLVTAHQLNRKAAEIVRHNPVGAVKNFAEDMMADSISVRREVDILFYMNKEFDAAGNAYLTFKLDKQRYATAVPEQDKFFAYPFFGELGLLDDINGQDMSTSNVYAYDYEGQKALALGLEPPKDPVKDDNSSSDNFVSQIFS